MQVATFAIVVVIAALYAYGSYWAFRIRQALFDRLYRSRAQWAGIAGAALTMLAASYFEIGLNFSDNFYLGLLQFIIDDAAAVVTFAWVDTTVTMARQLDPLRRNTLRWSRLRIFLWVFLSISTIGGLFSAVFEHALFFSSQGGQGVLLSGPFGFSTFGFIAIILSWRRARDLTLRRHLRWFALFLLVLLVASGATGGTYLASVSLLRLVSAVSLALGGYFLYRAARSLAPLSKRIIENRATAEVGMVNS